MEIMTNDLITTEKIRLEVFYYIETLVCPEESGNPKFFLHTNFFLPWPNMKNLAKKNLHVITKIGLADWVITLIRVIIAFLTFAI